MSHQYLILGLLADEPMTGYDIKKRVVSALSMATSASYGTLYPTLHKLLKEGSVEVQEIPQVSRPSKKVYSITDQGKEVLRGWLQQPPAADQIRREFLLKLYLGKDLPVSDLLSLVSSRRDEAETLLKTLRSERQMTSNLRQTWVMDYALSLCEAEIRWLANLESQLGVA